MYGSVLPLLINLDSTHPYGRNCLFPVSEFYVVFASATVFDIVHPTGRKLSHAACELVDPTWSSLVWWSFATCSQRMAVDT